MSAAEQLRAEAGHAVRAAVTGESGVYLGLTLAPEELLRVRSAIEDQWLGRIREVAPEHADRFAAVGLARYHELSHLVDHASIWPKAVRILPAEAVATIRATSLLRALEDTFGPFAISDEEGLGREEIYWRLVRPHEQGDTGPVHADRWFWDLGHGSTPADVERVKVWVAVVCEPGRSGLRLLPGSHRKQWRYHGEHRHGFVKPVIDEDVDALGLELAPTAPGQAVVFNDDLLHGGGVGTGELTRVSFEFTMFVAPEGARQ